MKKLAISILAGLSGFAFVYLLGADFNIASWDISGRFMVSLFGGVVAAGCFAITYGVDL